MPPRLILARHGNTFAPEDKAVWVGARSDLPLVEKGLAQARALAAALQNAALVPDVLIAGPLQRTRQTAQIVAETLTLAPAALRIDPRLTEIDYGAWEGKSTAEIIALGDERELSAWNLHSVYPPNQGWRPSEAQLIADTGAVLAEAQSGTSLLVTSNGILRFFARGAANASAFPQHKVATGHICVMERGENASWRITQWNQSPETLGSRG